MEQNDLKPIPDPVGKFIIDQSDIEPCVALDGSWWHYKDVVTLLKRYADEKTAVPQAKCDKYDKALRHITELNRPLNDDTAILIAGQALENEALCGEGDKGKCQRKDGGCVNSSVCQEYDKCMWPINQREDK